MSDRTRPGAPTGVACGFAGIGACLVVVLGTTGAGWLVVVLALVAGLLVAGLVLAWPATRSVGVSLQVPRDAVAGRPVAVGIAAECSGPFELRVPELGVGWAGVPASGTGSIEAVPRWRGVIGRCTVEVRSAAPLGMWWWRRRLHFELDAPLHVAPLPATVGTPWPPRSGADRETASATGARGDEVVRGVRDYVPGDPPKLVHWHASARTGALVVRELEAPSAPAVCVVCELGGPPTRVEAIASVCAGLVAAALAAGTEVVLATAEPGGRVVGTVESPRAAGRRLARAVPGPVRMPPGNGHVVHAAALVPAGPA